jgi:hypothetical protein
MMKDRSLDSESLRDVSIEQARAYFEREAYAVF